MHCPVCGEPLIIVERNNIEVDYCISCNGFWLDAGELELLYQISNGSSDIMSPFKYPAVKSDEKKYKCPICSSVLKKVRINEIIVDVCPNMDGIWFDKGELSEVINKFQNSSEKSEVINFLGENFCKSK